MAIRALRIGSVSSGWGRLLPRWRRCGLNLLFPPRCVRCDADMVGMDDDVLLCGECRGALDPGGWASCLRCGAPVSADQPVRAPCPLCERAGLKFDRAVTLGAYRSALRPVVLSMKQRQGETLSKAVGRLFCQRRGRELAELRADAVVPVPMFWTRRLVRGANSPDLLAECLSRHLGIPAVPDALVRCRNTRLQTSLPPKGRFKNVRGAFRLRAGYDWDGVRVLLADDILTTGATCNEAAGLLKRAGASMVAVAVLARGIGDESF